MAPAADGLNTRRLIAAVLAAWPQHASFLERHFASCEADDAVFIDTLAGEVLALAGDDLAVFAADYRWMCALFLKHELQYRRSRQLRHALSEEIRSLYYDNAAEMSRYMHGLLVSQLTWPQHLGAQIIFKRQFLSMLADGYRYLEIGPGHGVTMAVVGADPHCASLSGYDISAASIALTRDALARLGVSRAVTLELQDICAAPRSGARFEAICISQVLELVSSPQAAIAHLAEALAPGGVLFVNAPVEIRAPDHIRAWHDGAEIDALLAGAGLKTIASHKVHVDRVARDDRHGYSYVSLARRVATS